MNLKTKLKSYNFWVSLGSAVFLLLSLIGKQIGFTINENAYYDIFTSICGILVILGIITLPAGSGKIESEADKLSQLNTDLKNNIESQKSNIQEKITPSIDAQTLPEPDNQCEVSHGAEPVEIQTSETPCTEQACNMPENQTEEPADNQTDCGQRSQGENSAVESTVTNADNIESDSASSVEPTEHTDNPQ